MENEIIDQIDDEPTHSQDETNRRTCWICFGTDNDEFESDRDWVSPCKCCGSGRWVHQDCVQHWVDEKQKQNSNVKAHCPQCQTEYIIVYKEVGLIVRLLNKLDEAANFICLLLGAGSVVTFIYWPAASYGAVTVIQVMGEQEALKIMKNMDPLLLILILPVIPFSLILGKSINWKQTLLLWAQRITWRLPLLRTVMPSFLYEPIIISNNLFQYNLVPHTRTLCTALLFPTIATIVGNVLFDNNTFSYTKRALLGGLLYIAVKGVFKMYQHQHNNMRRKSLRVINYPFTRKSSIPL